MTHTTVMTASSDPARVLGPDSTLGKKEDLW